MSKLVGKFILNRYDVQEFLGRGGIAEVYKVWDSHRMTYCLPSKVIGQMWQNINGRRELAKRKHGDVIKIGSTEFEFREG